MSRVSSKDGTTLGFEKTGQGPPLILVGGAFQDRAGLAAHAALLSPHLTVFNYDRRGRGESGDTQPYAVEREIEDIDAMIQAAGGSAAVFGGSSGAVLALEAAAAGLSITELALYEPPCVVDDTRPPLPQGFVTRLRELIGSGRRGDAAAAYMIEGAQVPAEMVAQMRDSAMWPEAEVFAQTLVYDAEIMGDLMSGLPLRAQRWSSVTMPTLVMDGGDSPAWARNAVAQLAHVLPNAERRTLDGQVHNVAPPALAAALQDFLAVRAGVGGGRLSAEHPRAQTPSRPPDRA